MGRPLTPREAVEYWLDLALTTGANKQDFNMSEAVAGVMSALASGSGDHAELARDLRAFEGSDDLGNGDFTVCEFAADALEALLAENAALRAQWADADTLASKHFVALREKQDDAQALYHRATEAERKLAEAVGLLRDCLPWVRTITDLYGRVSAWLSKEAERG